MNNKIISIIGLGYVGLPLATHLSHHWDVVGYDINKDRVDELKRGVDNTLECDLSRDANLSRLSFTTSKDDIKSSSIYIITVPTPVSENNSPDLEPLLSACKLVGQVLKSNDLVIFESTVFPGVTEKFCVPALESESNLEYNKDFTCGYSPERINPGDKARTLANITKITSGSTKWAAEQVDNLYQTIIKAGTWKAPSIEVAEAAKVIENAQRDVNIAFMNEISKIFNSIGIDTAEVLAAAGTKWNFLPFKPGLVGGHCISVDPYYLAHVAVKNGCDPKLILAGREINDGVAGFVASKVKQKLLDKKIVLGKSRVGILGATFKEDCPDLRNSKVFDLISLLKLDDVDVKLCDPVADPEQVIKLSDIELVDIDSLSDLDALIVAVGHSEFRELTFERIQSFFNPETLILADLKSLYEPNEYLQNGFEVFRL